MSEPVTTALFAHVQAAIDDGFPLDEVLDKERISPAEWAEAQIAVRQRVASDDDARAEYEEALVAAQDRFTRTVAPVESDLAAWLALVDGMSSAPAPFAWLRRLGLRISDVARLRRRWVKRAQEDAALDQKIAELRSKKLPALPALAIGTIPYVALRAAPAPVTDEAPASRASGVVDGIGIDVLASIDAEIARTPLDAEAIFARHGVDRARHASVTLTFRAACARDATLLRDYQHLVTHNAQRLRRAQAAPPPTPAPSPADDAHDAARRLGERLRAGGLEMRGTAIADDAPTRAQPLPFASGAPSPHVALPSPPRPPAEHDDDLDSTTEVDRGRAAAGAGIPFAPPPPAEAHRLTFEQYASLTAELAHARAPQAQILGRYGIPQASWSAVEASWRAALAADPVERTRFDALWRQYLGHLRTL